MQPESSCQCSPMNSESIKTSVFLIPMVAGYSQLNVAIWLNVFILKEMMLVRQLYSQTANEKQKTGSTNLDREVLKRLPIFLISKVPQEETICRVLSIQSQNREFPGRTVNMACRGERLRDVFHSESSRSDGSRELDDEVALRPFEGPALSWLHVGLDDGARGAAGIPQRDTK